jgi:2-keto-4-pentenoate hydratase/2-oxohepta-3-ene-1,7-dioic acid hydratase in catechol pathway
VNSKGLGKASRFGCDYCQRYKVQLENFDHASSFVCETGQESLSFQHHRTSAFLYQSYQIVAIGRNYADHVKELRNTIPKEPFFFLKPTTSYVESGGKVEIPRGIIAHHEGTVVDLL